jgi:hypothetical protein
MYLNSPTAMSTAPVTSETAAPARASGGRLAPIPAAAPPRAAGLVNCGGIASLAIGPGALLSARRGAVAATPFAIYVAIGVVIAVTRTASGA